MIAAGPEVEDLGDGLLDLLRVDGLGAEGLDEQAHGRGLADRVGHLDLDARGQSGGHGVLGDPADGVRGGAVDLRRVLAGESAAAVTGHAAVGVDDDLAAGRPASPIGPPMTKRPVGLVEQPHVRAVEAQLSELGGHDVPRARSTPSRFSRSMPSACWVEMTTVSRRTGWSPAYSMVTWVLPSGRRYGTVPSLRTADRRRESRCATRSAAASSPACHARVAEHQPLVARALLVDLVLSALDAVLERRSTPCAMSGDCAPMAMFTPHEWPSKPFADES